MRWPKQRREDAALDVQDYSVETLFCDDCQEHYARVTGYVSEGDGSLAAYYAVCHGHPHHEVAVDLILGTWGSDAPDDHETFSCLIRPEGVMAVDPFVTLALDPMAMPADRAAILGHPVTRSEALQHPSIAEVWRIVDALVEGVAPVAEQYNSRP
jgi:hypothetical protein